MGQKTQPIGFRLGINRTWDSRWFGGKSYGELLHQDIELRKFLFKKLKAAAISKIVIERPPGRARISIYAGRPGLVTLGGEEGSYFICVSNFLPGARRPPATHWTTKPERYSTHSNTKTKKSEDYRKRQLPPV